MPNLPMFPVEVTTAALEALIQVGAGREHAREASPDRWRIHLDQEVIDMLRTRMDCRITDETERLSAAIVDAVACARSGGVQ